MDFGTRADLAKPADLAPPVDLAPPPIPRGPLGQFEEIPPWADQDLDDGAALKAYSRSPAVVADVLKDARVICQVIATSHFDTFKGADLTVEARIGGSPIIVHFGWSDYGSAEVLVPVSELRSGDEMSFRVVDRDVFGVEPMGTARAKYEGRFPQKIVSQHFKVDCHAMTRQQAELELPTRLAAVNAAIQKLRLTALPKERDFGRGKSGIPELLQVLDEAAAVAGWTHPRIKERAGVVEKRLQAWDDSAGKAVQRLRASLPPVDKPLEVKGFGRFRALPCRCAQAPLPAGLSSDERSALEHYRCLVEVELTPSEKLAVDEYMCMSSQYKRPRCLSAKLRLVLANGRTTRPKLIHFRAGEKKASGPFLTTELEADKTYVLTLDPQLRIAEPPDARRPVLLDGSFGTLRLD